MKRHIYRDLKLDNVLLDHEGHIKLTDMACARKGSDQVTHQYFLWTTNYIAPEILRGEDYGFSVDWWALGVLMFEMMAGRSPFDIITDNPDMNTEEYLFQGASRGSVASICHYHRPPGGLTVILEKPIRIPRSLSVKAASVLKGFLNKLEKKEVTPPFKPQISDDYGLENFDTQFTNEPVQLTPDDECLWVAAVALLPCEGAARWMLIFKPASEWSNVMSQSLRDLCKEKKRHQLISHCGAPTLQSQYITLPGVRAVLGPGRDVIKRIDQSEFEGFEYINPLLLSTEESV
ncbi:hypothetical protein INR49_028346 [Caranx melampygus]|nr:hypothetical protein INR49_028346 [Caranx melampygus]